MAFFAELLAVAGTEVLSEQLQALLSGVRVRVRGRVRVSIRVRVRGDGEMGVEGSEGKWGWVRGVVGRRQ